MELTEPQDSSGVLDLELIAAILERAVAVGQVGIWVWEPDSDFNYWNPVMKEIVGVDAETVPSLDLWLEVVHPEDRAVAREAIDHRALGEVRYRIVNLDDRIRHLIVRSEKVKPEFDGHPDLYMGLVMDVTENQEASSVVTDTLEAISDGYIALGTDWTVLYANRQSEVILGRPREVMLGRSLWDEFPEAVDSRFFTQYKIAMEERRPTEVEDYYEPLDIWVEARVYPIPQGVAVYFRDVTRRHLVEIERERMLEAERVARNAAELARADAEHQATHDPLTDLLNRTEFMRQLEEACRSQTAVTLFFLDVDRFKLVNDSLGHAMGDQLLREVGRRLEQFGDHVDLTARFGGDEFVIALFDRDRRTASMIAEQILSELRRPINLQNRLLHVTASLGAAESSPGTSAEGLLLNADVTLYRAKETGRDRVVWFDQTLRTELQRRVALESRLRESLEAEELTMHFQPAYDLKTGKLTDVEALARWHDSIFGEVSPVEFIPIAEESGLIHSLGAWAVGHVAKEAAAWHRSGNQPATFWANVSTSQLARPDIAFVIAEQLEKAGLEPERFGIEITESALADNVHLGQGLSHVTELGVKLAIDDFGTGFSSISRLRELPVDILKIDRSFVSGAGPDFRVETLTAIVDLAHALGATVIAEGIETLDEYRAIRETNCDRVSGRLFGYPVVPEELAETVATGQQQL